MVRDLFGVEPDPAQARVLDAFPTCPRIAMQSCTGSGKTATLAWLAWNFLLTRPHPIIGATSITASNLKSNLWSELARWYGISPLLQSAFELQKSQIISREFPATWKLEARAFAGDADATTVANALRGLHAKYVMWLLDETGAYPEAVLPTCEAIFSGDPVEAHIVQAGNPTNLGGPLYQAATKSRRHWFVVEITADPDDPHRTPRVSIDHARKHIETYGRDNPWVLVNIFGKFPPSSFNALIGPDEITEAFRRSPREYEIGRAPKIIGVDVARFGDDRSVMAKREGILMHPFRIARNVDSTAGAGWVLREFLEFQASAIFVDGTGGFGSGWVDQLRALGQAPIEVHFSAEAGNKARYANKRTEMYFDFVEWIRRGGALPETPELVAELSMTTYTFKDDKMILEPKEDVKAKIGHSPDISDAAALTFAYPVVPDVDMRRVIPGGRRHTYEYNPFEAV